LLSPVKNEPSLNYPQAVAGDIKNFGPVTSKKVKRSSF
jgi:hypothetical protein